MARHKIGFALSLLLTLSSIVLFLTAGLTVIALLGIAVSETARNNISAAYRHMEVVSKWWTESQLAETFPPLRSKWPHFWSTENLPKVLATVWVALLTR